jgi:hypothetical protein
MGIPDTDLADVDGVLFLPAVRIEDESHQDFTDAMAHVVHQIVQSCCVPPELLSVARNSQADTATQDAQFMDRISKK